MNRFDIARGLTPEEPQKPSRVSDIVPKKKKTKEPSSQDGLYLHNGSDATPIHVEDLSFTHTGSSIRVSLSFQIPPGRLNWLNDLRIISGTQRSQPDAPPGRRRTRQDDDPRGEEHPPYWRSPPSENHFDEFLNSL